MIVSISQPAYLPWLGYFERILLSDLHIVLDDVQIERSSKTRFTNRNKIRIGDQAHWLTVPIKTAGLGQPLISEIEIDRESNWRRKHWESIKAGYARAPYFGQVREWLENFYSQDWARLSPMLDTLTRYLLAQLKIPVRLMRSSDMRVHGAKSELILALCRAAGATRYISGPFGRDYLDLAAFARAGIDVSFHDYRHPRYRQVGEGFVSHLSVIDLLANEGALSAAILSRGASAGV